MSGFQLKLTINSLLIFRKLTSDIKSFLIPTSHSPNMHSA